MLEDATVGAKNCYCRVPSLCTIFSNASGSRDGNFSWSNTLVWLLAGLP